MDIFKIVGVGILGVITAGFIKSAKSEFSVFVVLATGLVILIMIAKGMSEVLVKFSEIVAKTGIPSALYRAIFHVSLKSLSIMPVQLLSRKSCLMPILLRT